MYFYELVSIDNQYHTLVSDALCTYVPEGAQNSNYR